MPRHRQEKPGIATVHEVLDIRTVDELKKHKALLHAEEQFRKALRLLSYGMPRAENNRTNC